MYVEQKNKGK